MTAVITSIVDRRIGSRSPICTPSKLMTHCPSRPKAARALTIVALLLSGCIGTPTLPTVDDRQRRPVNTAGAIDLQTCRAELQAARLLIAEAPRVSCPEPAAIPKVVNTPAARTAVLLFQRGQSRIELDAKTLQLLRELARTASKVEIHARGDQLQDTPGETALARRRAEGAASWVATRLDVPVEKLRVSWTGMAEATLAPEERRRVEIEFVERRAPPLMTLAAAPASPHTSAAPVRAATPTPSSSTPAPRPAPAAAAPPGESHPAATRIALPSAASSPSPTAVPPVRPAAQPDAPVALRVRQPS